MVEWLKIQDKSGDTYLINADNIIYIDEVGIVLRGYVHLKAQVDVELAERAITESRKTGERWLNGKAN